MSVDSPPDVPASSDNLNAGDRSRSKNEVSEISPSSNRRGYRDRSRSRSFSPRFSKSDRKSRLSRRDRLSRDDRSLSPISRKRSNSRDSRMRRNRDERRDRRKSKERGKSRRDKRRSRSRSRHKSPKRSHRNRRRHSSSSMSPDIMSTSLIGEIKKIHGDDFVSKSRKKGKKKHKRHSSSSSTSSDEMHVDGPTPSNGAGLNIPAAMPPPSMYFPPVMPPPMFSHIPVPPPPIPPIPLPGEQFRPPYPAPPANRDMFMVPPPQPPNAFPPPDTVYPNYYNVTATSSTSAPAEGTKPQSKILDSLPMPPTENKRIITKPVVLNRRGARRKVEPGHDEWGTTLITDYEMLDQIGEGTYGQVYKAVNKKTQEQVALKRVRLENEKEGFPITAVREIKILRQLNHKNIVRLIDIVTDNATVHELRHSRVNFYLVFEYVDHDLMGLLESKDLIEFSKEQICNLFKQLLEGIAYCHKAGFLHRDIKCSNILVNNRGELKVADLGLARLWHEGIERPYTNRVITLWYRPPELLLGEECYGPAIDIWSAGCMLGELFTRKPLFNGNNDFVQLDLITKVCGSPTPDNWPDVVRLKGWDTFKQKRIYPRRIREEFEQLMPALAVDLLDRLLSLDPKKRLTAREALNHPWIRSLDHMEVKPLKLPHHQDCHEMWSKKQKRGNRLSNQTASRKISPNAMGSGSGGSQKPKVPPKPSNGGPIFRARQTMEHYPPPPPQSQRPTTTSSQKMC